jgi:cytoskeletal protein CcmA (bactofilin family)
MTTFNLNPAPHDFSWTLQWKNWLNNLWQQLTAFFAAPEFPSVTTETLIVEGDGLVEGTLQVAGDLSANDAAFSGEVTISGGLSVAGTVNGMRLGGAIDTTNLSYDYPLHVGEVAKVSITGAPTPLNIAVKEGVYEIDLIFDATTFLADQRIDLLPNNTTYAGMIAFLGEIASIAIATDEVDIVDASIDAHRFSGSVNMRPHHANGRLTILGNRTSLFTRCRGRTVAGDNYMFEISTSGDIGVAHTSLGTIDCGEACTGMAYIKCVA